MKERPILFNGEMVRAILAGRKCMTRRVVKLNEAGRVQRGSKNWHLDDPNSVMACPYGQPGDRLWVRETFAITGNEDGHPVTSDGHLCEPHEADRIYRASCSRGDYGLWDVPGKDWQYDGPWKPSIFMPRWASRILLEIVSVRVDRLQEISEADARAEGIQAWIDSFKDGPIYHQNSQLDAYPVTAFSRLWESINGPDSWEANPWVWVVEFERTGGES